MLGVERSPLELGSLSAEEREDALGKEQQFRKSSKGNIRFIGELFKRSLLSEKIIHRCEGAGLLFASPLGGSVGR